MPGADDLLEAMRKAGQDFARMADSIEARLPAIMNELAAAATQLQPLTAELSKIQGKIKDISKASGGITFSRLADELKDANAGMATLFKSADTVSKKLGKITMRHINDEIQGVSGSLGNMAKQTANAAQSAIREISGMGRALGDTLEERTTQTQKLASNMKDLGKLGVAGDNAGGGKGSSLEIRNAAEMTQNYSELVEMADAFASAGDGGNRAIQSLQAHLTGIGQTTMSVDDDITDLVNSYKALGPAIGKAKDNAVSLAKGTGLEEWKKDSTDALKSIEEASEDIKKRSGIDLGHSEWIDDLEKRIRSLGTDAGPEAFAAVAKEMENLKAKSRLISNDMIGDIKKQAEEMEGALLFGRGQEAKMYKWRKSQQVMQQMLQKQGHSKRMSDLISWWTAWKNHPLKSVRQDIDGIGEALSRSAATSGLFTKGFVATAKNAMGVRDKIIESRQELMKLTAEGGKMSAMLQRGMGGDAVIAEFDKINVSIDNLFNRTGMTSKATKEMMGTLMEAGYSFEELAGDTIKAGEAQGILRQEGEYAMTGLEDLSRLATMTGRSFGDIAKMAGKWREELGVTIGDVKDTYLEVESQARRSGLSVGKFMDRVMSATSGFVLFGARAEDVAATMSNLMAQMDLPPSMAADMAKSFTDVMQETTVMGAMEITAFLGGEGQKWMKQQLGSYVNRIKKDKALVDKQIAETEAKMKEESITAEERDKYEAQLMKLNKRAKKAAADLAEKDGLLKRAAAGDDSALTQAIWYMQKSGDSSAAQAQLMANAARLGIDIQDDMAAGMDPMVAMQKAIRENSKNTEFMVLLQNNALVKQLGGIQKYKAHIDNLAEGNKRREKMVRLLAEDNDKAKEMEELIRSGDPKDISDAIADNLKTPQQVLEKLRELRTAGVEISEEAMTAVRQQVKDFEDAQGMFFDDKEKQAEAATKAIQELTAEMTGKREPPDDKALKGQMDPLVSAQQTTDNILKEHQKALMNKIGPWGTLFIGILANTALMAVGSFGGVGKLGKAFGRFGKGVGKAGGRFGQVVKTAGGKLFTGAKSAGGALKAVGQSIGKIAPKSGVLSTVGGAVKSVGARVGARVGGLATGASKLLGGGAAKSMAKVGLKRLPGVGAIIGAGFAVTETASAYKAATAAAEKSAKATGKTEKQIARARSEAGKKAIKETGAGAAGGAVGAGVGALVGGVLGSIVPVLGNVVGIAVGGIVGEKIGSFIGGLTPAKRVWSGIVDSAYSVGGAFSKVTKLFTRDAKELEEAQRRKREATTREIRASEDKAASIEDEIMAVEQGPDVDPFADVYAVSAEEAAAAEKEKKKKLAELEEKLFQERKKQIMALAKEEANKSWTGRAAFALRKGKVEEQATRMAKKYASKQLQSRREGGKVARVARTGVESEMTAEAKERDRKIRLAKLEEEMPAFDVKRVSRGGMAYLSLDDIVINSDEMAKAIDGARGTAAGPFRVGGGDPGARGKAEGLMRGVVSASTGEGDVGAAAGAFTDNSTWTVNISSHRDKEIEGIVRKVMIEQQERQAP